MQPITNSSALQPFYINYELIQISIGRSVICTICVLSGRMPKMTMYADDIMEGCSTTVLVVIYWGFVCHLTSVTLTEDTLMTANFVTG